jgi:Zn-dependent protease
MFEYVWEKGLYGGKPMKIGQVRGINLKVSRFLPALFLIYFLLGIGDKALLVFAIILIHELGHVFCAVFWGMRVDTFELFPLGGVARMENLYVGSLGKEIVLYLTGPLVNFFLGGVCFALCFYLKEKETMAFLGQASLAIGLFNLIPAWPLDGGRIFQAILSRLAGYLYAARFVSLIGQLWAVIFFIYGVWAMAYSPVNLHWWIIAVFLFYLNKREKGIVYLSFMHYSLDELAYSLDIDRSSAHRALGDARTTGLLFLRLQQILKDLDFVVLETLFLLSQKTKSTLSCLFAQVYRQRMSSFPREGIKSRQLYSQGDMRMGIFSSHPQPEFIEDYEITPEELAPIFQPGGRMETMIQGFRYRPEQEEMAKETARCWNQGGYLIVEAGTGIGKSLAYLLPSVLWSINAGHKVIVSTHTINLQEQLKNKDIPLAAKISGRDFSSSVIKGRSHYLCLRKWEQFINESNQEILRLIMRLAIWLNQTETGDIDELNLNKKEKADWQHLAAASETCLGIKCKFYRGQCFVSRARKLAEQSQIIIVNHSLLLANAMANDNILPEYKYLVIDEAHQLEKTAEEQFTIDINYFALWAVFQKLIKGGNPSSRNILEHLTKKMVNHPNLDQDLRDELISLLEDIGLIGEECLSAAREFFGVISGILPEIPQDPSPHPIPHQSTHNRLPVPPPLQFRRKS